MEQEITEEMVNESRRLASELFLKVSEIIAVDSKGVDFYGDVVMLALMNHLGAVFINMRPDDRRPALKNITDFFEKIIENCIANETIIEPTESTQSE